jgi:hypothetical protein
VLGVLLIGVLAYEVPSLMKSKKPPVSSAVATPAPTAGVPVAGGPVTAAPIAAPVPSTTLSDSDPLAQASSGQLLSFDRFSSKDPFIQQAGAAASASTRPPPAKTKKPEPKPPVAANPTPPTPAPTAARISVNGIRELVDLGKAFPSSDPVFRLVSLTRTTAKIGIAGGSLSTGDATATLTKGKKVTLMNTADGTRYELLLVSLI